MTHIGKKRRFEFVGLLGFLLCLHERMFEFHLMVDTLRDGTYLDHSILRFVFRHHRINLQIIPLTWFAGAPNLHSSVEPYVLALPYGIAEIVAHSSVIRM